MKYIKLTFEYLSLRKWLIYSLLALIPALSFIVLTSELSITRILMDLDNIGFDSFGGIIDTLFGKMKFFWVLLTFLFLDSVLIAFILGTIDRDMRLGDFKLQHFIKRVNFNFLTALIFLLLITATFAINKIIVASIILLWMQLKVHKAVTMILILITAGFFFVILVMFFSLFFIAPPLAASGGRRFFVSLSESVLYTKDRIFAIFCSIMLPSLIKLVLIQAFSLINKDVAIIAEVFLNIFLTVYMIALTFVIYYDVLDLERVDKKNIFY